MDKILSIPAFLLSYEFDLGDTILLIRLNIY
jgi:hypothetical protein